MSGAGQAKPAHAGAAVRARMEKTLGTRRAAIDEAARRLQEAVA
jgi:hypothetical protein